MPVVKAQTVYQAARAVYFSLCTATLMVCSPTPEDTLVPEMIRAASNETGPSPVHDFVMDDLTGGFARMELDIRLEKESLSITIEDPFRIDFDALVGKIDDFLAPKGVKMDNLDVRGLLPRMVKGIAGCEAGCPSDAKSVVKKGYNNFKLEYIEGGILSATAQVGQGKTISLKLFPDF